MTLAELARAGRAPALPLSIDLADGERLLAALRERLPVTEAHLVEVGPAVGAHAGQGTLVVGLQPSPE